MASAQAQEALRRDRAAGGLLDAGEGVAWNRVSGQLQCVLCEVEGQRRAAVGCVEGASAA